MTVTANAITEAELPEDASLWEKRMQALTMRNAGATWARIAETYNISDDRARTWVRKAMQEVVKLPVDQMVDRQRAILLDITRRNYPVAMGDGENAREAQGVIIRCLEHEAKLFGLYAPARVSVGISESEFGQQAAELLQLVGVGPLAEIAGISQKELSAALGQRPEPVSAGQTKPQESFVTRDETPPLDAEVVPDEPWSNL